MSAFKPEIIKEGDGVTRLLNVIEYVGYNPDGRIRTATVTSEYPNFRIRVTGDTVDTPSQGITSNPDLFNRTETVKIDGVTRTIEYPNRLVVGARVLVFEPAHQQLLYLLTMGV
ncbi:hypothetical protein FH508_0014880 [Lysinibacillus sp. CD3-6]|uniref:hypothetical protein n=1 Tax=Lysinibacillus sp. CD3-6 TaxID=2892541 RepID=UPI001123E4C0|nr:hypothetical protein [Lysinibacillus sp. CD3-6]UED78736.1 hypothetical protein FH508_0014880 [Lysinibacillus sp. CD3-6]